MEYYKGTYHQCNEYDAQVTAGENCKDNDNWAVPIMHPNGEEFAIVKHPNYTAPLELVDTLGNDWFPEGV